MAAEVPPVDWFELEVTSGSVAPNGSQIVSATLHPQEVGNELFFAKALTFQMVWVIITPQLMS